MNGIFLLFQLRENLDFPEMLQKSFITSSPGLYSRIWDEADYVIPPAENGALFVTTNVVITPNQTRGKKQRIWAAVVAQWVELYARGLGFKSRRRTCRYLSHHYSAHCMLIIVEILKAVPIDLI